ncbi:NfeD family protein [Candidatus Protochlamydia phocaeensis]|uniref:NfeD family protein n=1 Tax=Candidatus Protochlamydia phocaeensis TaxID=1414722 RepID=UPI00083989DF|nr:NfeD family protein [Candidatus Protochlamydia phocaeensis]
MMPFIFLLIGLFLILIEFYLPGAIMGIIGSVFVLTSIVLFASQTNSAIAITLFVFGVAVSIGLLIRFAIWRIKHAKPEYSIYLHKDQEGYQASSYDKDAIGKIGIVLSDLKPGGYVLIEGKQHQAISVTGYIPKGEKVLVISGQEESLLVQLSKKES